MTHREDDEYSNLYIWLSVLGVAVGIGLAEDRKYIPCVLVFIFSLASITWPRWKK